VAKELLERKKHQQATDVKKIKTALREKKSSCPVGGRRVSEHAAGEPRVRPRRFSPIIVPKRCYGAERWQKLGIV